MATSHDAVDLDAVLATLIGAALVGGRMMLECDRSKLNLDFKSSSVDLVTAVDKAIENAVRGELQAAHPTFEFFGEETYKPGDKLTGAPTFVVDPIDGTTNFVHSFPMACISLGLAVDRHPVVGVIYNPWFDQMYASRRGGGAWLRCPRTSAYRHHSQHSDVAPGMTTPPAFLHGSDETHCTVRLPLARPDTLSLGGSTVALAFDTQRSGPNFDTGVEMSRRLMASRESGGAQCQGLRSLGSAALQMAHVAAGQIDAWWQGGCMAWDVCGGWAILEEAGGLVVGTDPGIWAPALDGRLYFAIRPAAKGAQRKFAEDMWALSGSLIHRF